MDITLDDPLQESVKQCMERKCRWSAKTVGISAHPPKDLMGQPLKDGTACTMPSCRAACFYR
jgi:hypothetical protein